MKIRHSSRLSTALAAITAVAALAACASAQAATSTPFLPVENTISTVPTNGDLNPYGVAFVPSGFPTGGVIHAGDLLVTNFNNSANTQGTGTTIVSAPANGGPVATFWSVPHNSNGKPQTVTGLDAALVVLSQGKVIAGFLPVPDGTYKTAQPGGLLIIGEKGDILFTFLGGGKVAGSKLSAELDGPWGMAIKDNGSAGAVLYISNVLNGTVLRVAVNFTGGTFNNTSTVIASGLAHENDANGFLLGPSGLAYNAATDVLYVANSQNNTISEIKNASTLTGPVKPTLVFDNLNYLHGPLDLVIAPNGDLLVANSDGSNADPAQPSEIVEITTGGTFVRQFDVDASNGGAFGIAVRALSTGESVLAYTDDNGGGGAVPTLTTIDLAN